MLHYNGIFMNSICSHRFTVNSGLIRIPNVTDEYSLDLLMPWLQLCKHLAYNDGDGASISP